MTAEFRRSNGRIALGQCFMKQQMEDYYKILGVSKSASQAEIKRAYRKLAQKYHPDLAEDKDKAKGEFQKLQQAYEVLKDSEKRQMYDQLGPDFERMGGAAGGNPFSGFGGQGFPGGGHGGRSSAGAAGFDFGEAFGNAGGSKGFSFEDIFRQFGGADAAENAGRRGPGGRGGVVKGEDFRTSVTVPFSVAIAGGETSVSIGRGQQYQTIKVKIPAGIEAGKKIRLRGQGEPSPNGGPPGDLLLEVNVSEHPHYRRQGDNLLLSLPISLAEAAAGAKVDVPTPRGTVTVTVPPGSSSGKKLRLRGLGVAGAKDSTDPNAKGDLVIELSIVIPESISPADLKLINQLSSPWIEMQSRQDLRW